MSKLSKVNEGLEHGDLHRLVKPELKIDEFKSKLGDDEDVCVLSFTVIGGKEPALDLVSFAEKGYGWVIDADTSAGEDDDGNFLVFIEVERTADVPEQVMKLMSDLMNLTKQSINDWKFGYRNNKKLYSMDIDSLKSVIPLTAQEYKKLFGREVIDSLKAAAGVKVDTKAPKNEYTESLRNNAGIIR